MKQNKAVDKSTSIIYDLYLSYRRAGFGRGQALDLVKAHILSTGVKK